MPAPLWTRRYDERGIALSALSSPVAMLSLAAVVLAGVAFVSTSGQEPGPPDTAQPVTATPNPTASPVPEPEDETATAPSKKKAAATSSKKVEKPQEKARPTVRRGDVYVEVYNNSGIAGLAGSTAQTISGAGWQVVGSDNWYGTIPATTVYYPDRLRAEAKALAKDLGIGRLKPAISPMRFDRLTVILTADYS